jgi:small subunit ribosomal protein S6
MRKYEIMLIVPADADDKVVGGAVDRISAVLAQHGGQVDKVDKWGKRRFAYVIDKATEGFYLVVQFETEPDAIRELDRVLTLADEVIRFKVTVQPPPRVRKVVRVPDVPQDLPLSPPAIGEETAHVQGGE